MVAERAARIEEPGRGESAYRLDGRRLDRISEVASALLRGYRYSKASGERGNSIHDALHIADSFSHPGLLTSQQVRVEEGGEDDPRLSWTFKPYIQTWEAACTALSAKPVASELRVASLALGVAGRLDRVLELGSERHIAVCDIKTGLPIRWHIYQVELYAHCLAECGLPVAYCMLAYLGASPATTYIASWAFDSSHDYRPLIEQHWRLARIPLTVHAGTGFNVLDTGMLWDDNGHSLDMEDER